MGSGHHKKESAIAFCADGYKKGYTDEWPKAKKARVFDIIRNLPLPETGKALDFGCGNGVFTDVIRQALPRWEVYGCDISSVSIENAKKHFPGSNFFVSGNKMDSTEKFDFVFSHHVLEHVFDIQKTLDEIDGYLKDKAFALYIFPCGNPGSFEESICRMRVDGINPKMENRFFFEDEGHLRRLTTGQTNRLMEAHRFRLVQGLYSNQYWGALKWVTQTHPKYITGFADYRMGKSAAFVRALKKTRNRLLMINYLQLPYLVFRKFAIEKKRKKATHYLIMAAAFIPGMLTYPFFLYVNAKAEKEWQENKTNPGGSEMYLFYERQASA